MQNTGKKSISLTNTALARIDDVMNANSDLGSKFRVYVTGGGCSGFQYGFKFDKEVAYDDDVVEFKNFSILLDFMILFKTIKIIINGKGSIPEKKE